MDIHQQCASIKEQVAAALREAVEPQARGELLIGALYELSRSVFPALGAPGKGQEYQECREAVLDLISFIVIPMIRGRLAEQRGVVVLAEIAEGCLDPLLRKKLTVYAQELLARSTLQSRKRLLADRRWLSWLVLGCAGVTIVVPIELHLKEQPHPPAAGVIAAPHPPQPAVVFHPSASAPPSRALSAQRGDVQEGSESEEGASEEERAAERPVLDARAAVPGEQVTRVRVVNNQVLVPVTLKNGGQTVGAELILDTGATRTAIHDELAGRLHIDLRFATSSQSEVADGRVISSRTAKVDSLSVGPFSLPSAEVVLISYKGTDAIHDGLLGMDFLGRHRYQLDMERQLIRWY